MFYQKFTFHFHETSQICLMSRAYPIPSVIIVTKYAPAFYPPNHYVVQNPGSIQPCCSWHVLILFSPLIMSTKLVRASHCHICQLCRPDTHVFTSKIDTGLPTLVILRIKLFCAFRTNPMAEFSFRVSADIGFDLIPVTFVVTDLFTTGTDGKNSPQNLYFLECFLKLRVDKTVLDSQSNLLGNHFQISDEVFGKHPCPLVI